MANYRVVLIFNFLKTPITGFSERYDFTSSSDDTAQNTARSIMDLRRAFLSSDWSIIATRLARIAPGEGDQLHKIVTKQVILCPAIGPFIGLLGEADTPASSVFADFFYNSVRLPSHRQFRGIPDDWWVGSELTQARDAIGTFCKGLKARGHVRYVLSTDGLTIGSFALKCCAVRRISSRRVGRPFALLRGRRSKRRVTP